MSITLSRSIDRHLSYDDCLEDKRLTSSLNFLQTGCSDAQPTVSKQGFGLSGG